MPDSTQRRGRIGRIGALAARGARFVVREPGAALLALRMSAWVAALSLLVKFMPLPRALGVVAPSRLGPTPRDPEEAQAALARLLDTLLSSDFWVFTPTCWKRAPVLHRYLALRGIETRIVFGVRRDGDDALSGHAWLEREGRPLLESKAPDYRVTYSFP
jgi:hypothetical protein